MGIGSVSDRLDLDDLPLISAHLETEVEIHEEFLELTGDQWSVIPEGLGERLPS